MSASVLTFPGAPTPDTLFTHPLNDLGNAMRLIVMSGGRVEDDGEIDVEACNLLYILNLGWIGFNGVFWDREYGEDLARKRAHGVAAAVRAPEFYAYWDGRGTPKKDIFKFQNDCGSAGKTTAMLRQAQSYLTVKIDAFDRDPLALNCRNGTLKMRRIGGKLQFKLFSHNAADRITRCTGCDYEPKALATLFLKTLDQSFPDAGEREAWHRMMGYCSTGLIEEQAFFLNQGPGRDGKSTLLDAIREALGTYAATAKVETFLDGVNGSGSGPQPDLIALAGDVRLAIVSEAKRGSKFNEGLLKLWTGGSPISARDLNAKPITFRPVAKLVWEMNAFPVAKGDDDGIWRRIFPYLFRRQVPKDEVDRQLPKRLLEELPGILNWLLTGVGDWTVRGLDLPESLVRVLDEYRRSSSPFGEWLNDRCVFGEAAKDDRGEACWTTSKALHDDYKVWSEEQGFDTTKLMGTKAFGDALRDRQINGRKDRHGNKIRGPIRLKTMSERREAQAAAGLEVTALAPAARIEEPGSFDISDEDWMRGEPDQ